MEAYAVLETGGKQVLVKVGDTVEIVLMRGNDKITVNAVLEAIPEE